MAPTNALYYGDNLVVLRENIPAESVDLIYLDPPFNSKRDYNLLFKSPKGQASEAQITAFKDSWSWGAQAEREFDELLHQPNTEVSKLMQTFRGFLDQSDIMAYLTMMSNRLLELHRALKPTGSLYLHCDPTASHYLKGSRLFSAGAGIPENGRIPLLMGHGCRRATQGRPAGRAD